jgi:hypothetical protein
VIGGGTGLLFVVSEATENALDALFARIEPQAAA